MFHDINQEEKMDDKQEYKTQSVRLETDLVDQVSRYVEQFEQEHRVKIGFTGAVRKALIELLERAK